MSEPTQASARKPDEPRATQPPERPKPWRTEGLPSGDGPEPPTRPRWPRLLGWIALYLAIFAVITVQDFAEGPETVSYTEFKAQVAAKNVEEVFTRGDSIQGGLRKAVKQPDDA